MVERIYAYELDYVYGKDVTVTILNNCEKKEL
ncbi:hypothetical protein QOZ91_002999 [Clostridium sardiniense]|nr:hypothetical protein [Clostridium sardiniense]